MVYLDEIRPWKTTWLIEAKVIHTWKPSNLRFGETLEIILADKKGIKVHATCRKNYLKSLGDKCIVGEWKTIENFQVSEPGKQFRPTKLMYKISFINQTVIKPNDFQNDDMFLALAEFDSVLSGSLETEFLIDIVGQAIDVGELRILHSNGKKLRKIEFTLRNVSDVRIQCCLWGKIADEMENHREEAQFGVVVCLIRFSKIGSFRGILQISNAYDSSKLVIAEIHEEGNQIVTKAKYESPKTSAAWKEYEDKTISEILRCTQVQKCKVVATIYAIDTDYAWYYFGCDACQHMTYKVLEPDSNTPIQTKPLFWCEICKKNVTNVAPKFKLHLMAKDDKAEAKFILLDWVAMPVRGVKAEKILNGSFDEVEDPALLPECIKKIAGKTFRYGITFDKGGDNKFKVLKVWSVYNTLMVDSQSETMSGKGTTAISGSEGSILSYSDESSSKMTTPSKRSCYDIIDHLDTTSTSKIRPMKIIKIEKMSNEDLDLTKE
ncbi:hypothetical protein IGI04_035906 [Brassica rapa subsp. trilocularis]|uniref:Replication protein A 70 kDa DNA-binding subunit B/D first OB fold domain-containing protein n=1 Tax=Brassica rapa subsp. trilocularis TaxID=1813537 RepID=A0ABQ7LCY3_BRACM|nr:hypothetical protein IGI04_035906 [Brassica rapa subsp. trilocularis]